MLGIIRFFKEIRIFIVAVLKFNINKKLQVLIFKSALAKLQTYFKLIINPLIYMKKTVVLVDLK